MVSGTEGELPKSKIDPCGICGRRVMANSVHCTNVKIGCMEDALKQRRFQPL